MVSFKVLYADGSPAIGVTVKIDVPGKEFVKKTDQFGNVAFDIPIQRGRISIDGLPLFYGLLEVDAFRIPPSKK
ncbi:MAG: hypothetical protein AAF587_00940 [Bacteroidota bacterium]